MYDTLEGLQHYDTPAGALVLVSRARHDPLVSLAATTITDGLTSYPCSLITRREAQQTSSNYTTIQEARPNRRKQEKINHPLYYPLTFGICVARSLTTGIADDLTCRWAEATRQTAHAGITSFLQFRLPVEAAPVGKSSSQRSSEKSETARSQCQPFPVRCKAGQPHKRQLLYDQEQQLGIA